MTFNVDPSLWEKYYEIVDWMIDDNHIGNTCTLLYPPKRVACSSCQQPVGGGSNVFQHGGSGPFNFPDCPMCGGSGYKNQVVTEDIKLRVYWRRKDWIRVGDSMHVDSADAQIIGYLSDLPKLKKASELLVCSHQSAEKIKMKLSGKPVPHGFKKDRYFVAYLEEA